MNCPSCAAQGITSEVTIVSNAGSTLAWQPHTDERGLVHEHDPNIYRTTYRCARGHQWLEKTRKPCPLCGETSGLGGPFRRR